MHQQKPTYYFYLLKKKYIINNLVTFLNTIKNHINAKKYNLKFYQKEENNLATFEKIWN